MNTNKFLKNSMMLFTMLLLSHAVIAQDRIIFTWQGRDGGSVPFMFDNLIIRATDGEQFTIDWGDDTPIETKTGLGITDIDLIHNYWNSGNESEFTVTIAASDTNCKFIYFDCHTCLADDVPCFQITGLALEWCADLAYLDCRYNALQLSDLYAAHLVISDQGGKLFGRQYLPYQPLTGGMSVDFSEQNMIGGVKTFFSVRKNGWGNAILNVDYSIDNGVITFINDGEYKVIMTNGAIIAHPDYPAEVVAGVDRFNINISEHFLPNIKIYPNPTNDIVFIQTDNGIIPEVKLYSIQGALLLHIKGNRIDISSLQNGFYIVNVDGVCRKIVKQ